MEEKKTKKMTKVEAYVYLNDTKVYVNGKGNKILEVLSKVGFEPTFPQSDVNAFPFMLISDKQVTYYGHMKQYLGLPQKEVSADDILSIEIVEEEDTSMPKVELERYIKILQSWSKRINSSFVFSERGMGIVRGDLLTKLEGEEKGAYYKIEATL